MEQSVATTKARVFASIPGGADLDDLTGPFLMALLRGTVAEVFLVLGVSVLLGFGSLP